MAVFLHLEITLTDQNAFTRSLKITRLNYRINLVIVSSQNFIYAELSVYLLFQTGVEFYDKH